ncbi:MAG TPA: hypothetical protein VMV46_21720 [Thermoanaerobaculia bacterium]|nr:hypothetical protein [Thermoanaerobaculia bacterium]
MREHDRFDTLRQHATGGGSAEYAEIEETFAPEALEAISGFILERLGDSAGGRR